MTQMFADLIGAAEAASYQPWIRGSTESEPRGRRNSACKGSCE